MNKVVHSAAEALDDITDGSTVMLGGFGLCGVPEDLITFAAARSCVQVFGGFTPAFLNAGTLYQTSDLFAALKTSAYCLPLNVPSFFHAGAKFLEIVALA